MAITGKVILSVVLAAALAMTACNFHSKIVSAPVLGKKFTSISWSDCDKTGSPYFTVTNVLMTGTPASGSTITVTINGNTVKNWVHGSTYWETSYGIFGVQAKGTEVVNPPKSYTPGPLSMVSPQTLNQDPPTGNYQTKNQFKDNTGKVLQCVLIKYSIAN